MGKQQAIKFIINYLAGLLSLLFLIFVYKCPINYFLKFPCPGCGITRAHLAALSLDFEMAFKYHPLFLTVAPTVLYAAFRNKLKKRLSDKSETIIFSLLLILFVLIYIYRLLSGALAVLTIN